MAPAVHPLFLYCEIRGNFGEGVILFTVAAAKLTSGVAGNTTSQAALQPLLGQVLARLGVCEVMVGNYLRGEQLLQDSLQLITQDGERAFTLVYLGLAAAETGELSLSRTRLHESLAISQANNDAADLARALLYLQQGASDYAEAHRICSESLAFARKAGRPDLIAHELIFLGFFKCCLGDYAAANVCWQEGMELCDTLELRNEKAWALDCIGLAAWCQGDMAAAERYIGEALAIYTELGRQTAIGMCMAELALVLASRGQVQRAIALARQAVAITRAIDGQMMLIFSLNYLGAALLAAGELVEARHTLLEAVQRAWDHQYLFSVMIAFYYFAELLAYESHYAELPDALERKCLAVALLSCVRAQAATWQIFKDKAAELQAQIESALPVEMLTAALRQGESRTVAQMVGTLLGDKPAAQVGEVLA